MMRLSRRADGSRAPFDPITIALHWLTVMLITFQAASGLALEFAQGVPARPLFDFHRSGGALVWCVALIRMVWRATFAKFPPFPDGMPGVQRWLATRTEFGLYALLLLQPLTGIATTLSLGKPFALLFWMVPAIVHRNLGIWQALLTVHRIGAYCLFAIIGGHAAMALIHHCVRRDDVLTMMAPWARPRSGDNGRVRQTQIRDVHGRAGA